MKTLLKMLALTCCFGLVVACGDDPEDNGEDNDTTTSAQVCVPTCEEDSDCGDEENWNCVDERCESDFDVDNDTETDPCEDDAECVATFSGWMDMDGNVNECEDQAGCDAGFSCVDYEGQGYCAAEATADCADGQEEQNLELVDEDGDVDVCVAADAECDSDGVCFQPQCEEDADCDDVAGTDVCSDGWCVCDSDATCEEDVDNADTCFDGVCGCSDDEVCEEDQACDAV